MNLKASLEALNEFFAKHPARFFLLAAVVWMAIMGIINNVRGIEWNDIWVEANGMAFDLLVFGVLLSIYEVIREKREKVERLHEEIDDYRGWNEKEATFRIVGAVRRLNKEGVYKISLNRCFLNGANLGLTILRGAIFFDADLRNANFSGADLSEGKLHNVNLSFAKFCQADLREAALFQANLTETNFSWAKLNKAMLFEANLSNANLLETDLSDTNLANTNLSGALLNKAKLIRASLVGADLANSNFSDTNLDEAWVGQFWFEKLDRWQVIGREEIKRKYYINEEGRLIKKNPDGQL